jgi:arylsulfatase A-like enzyme
MTLTPGAHAYRLELPDGALVVGANEIGFRFAFADFPLDHGSRDARRLAAAFDVLTVGRGVVFEDAEPRAVDETLVLPAGYSALFTFRSPEQPVLDFERVRLQTGGTGSVAGEVWVRQPGSSFERLGVVDDVGVESRAGWRLPLDVQAGGLVQVKLTAIGESPTGQGPHEFVWHRPWLYGRQSHIAQLDDVVLIVVDTLRADFVGAYGGEVDTPNIDALAERGVLFRNAYSHIPITGPSHASIFTSLLPVDHGVHNNGQILDRELESLPELLASWGRYTVAFVSLGVLKGRFGFDRGFDSYHDQFGWDWMKNARDLNREAFDWLEESPPGARFLWLHYSDPHEPYTPPGLEYPRIRVILGGQELAVVYADGRGVSLPLTVAPGRRVLRFEGVGEIPPSGIRFPMLRVTDDRTDLELKSGWSKHDKRFGDAVFDTLLPASAELRNRTGEALDSTLEFSCKERLTLAETRQRYAQEVAFVDREIGALMTRLEETGRLDRTLLIFTSDHGEGLGDHDHVGHISQLYDTLIRVPLIFVAPGRLAAGTQIDHPVGLVDIAPTVAELLGLQLEAEVRGRSLVPLLEGGAIPDWPIIAETYRPEAYSDKRAIISGGFKYIWSSRDHVWVELYDLADDPSEQMELSRERPELASELRKALDREFESSQRSLAIEADISEQDAARLRALGYAHD